MCISLCGNVAAQERNTFALGVNYTQRLANDERAHGEGGIGITWRLGHSDEGWGFTYGLGWFATDMEQSIGGRTMRLGELKIRPIVGGYGYTHRFTKRLYVTGDLVGGFAITTLELTPEAADAYRLSTSAGDVETRTRVIPIVRPELKTWYDLNRRWGITIGGWYAIARPNITVVTPAGRETLQLHADTFSFTTGVVYRIF